MNIMITGASRGIGLELVKYFTNIGNNNILALSRNVMKLNELFSENRENNSVNIYPINIDIENLSEIPVILSNNMPKEIKHIDILINNAGFLTKKTFIETSTEEIEKMFRINCIGPALLIRCLNNYFGKDGRKTHIVNISSIGGIQGSVKFPGISWYSASKSAFACLTECLQEEYKKTDLVFNCLALGAVQTEMFEEAFPGYKAPLKPEEMADFIGNFALNGYKYMRGKIIPVSLNTP